MRPTTTLPACEAGAATGLHGAVLLAGWLWLGYQGMRLGWSLGGGLGVVALWWALRLLLAEAQPAQRRSGSWAMGLLTGLGVWLIEREALGGAGLPVLLATAVAWALWAAALSPAAACTSVPPASGSASTALATRVLPATAMGLMMGSLWLTGQWCASSGWPASAVVLLHIGGMVLLPALLRAPARRLHTHALGRDGLPLALLALGGVCVMGSPSAVGGMLGMALQATAWALSLRSPQRAAQTALHHADKADHPESAPPATPVHTHRRLGFPACAQGAGLALCGPLLLWLVGLLSPTAGPTALHGAQALVGTLALLALLPPLWRQVRRTHTAPVSPAPSTQTDAP